MRPRSNPLFAVSLLAVAALACSRTEKPTAAVNDNAPAATQGAGATPAAGKKQFGAAITENTPTALGDIMREPGKFADKTVRTEGNVKAVCQEMGCWMEVEDPSGLAHIKMAGHAFFVPRDSTGHRAVVQGKVIAPVAPAAPEGGDDCMEEAHKATGQIAKVQIEATGIEFVD